MGLLHVVFSSLPLLVRVPVPFLCAIANPIQFLHYYYHMPTTNHRNLQCQSIGFPTKMYLPIPPLIIRIIVIVFAPIPPDCP